MPSTRLEFNLVGPIPFHSGTNLGVAKTKQEVLSTYLTLIKSSSYWNIANLDISGSKYEALVLRPTINSEIDQRIIITMNATASANAWGNRTAATAETNSGGHLQVGLCPTSASYVHYTSDVPFGPNRRWSRYWSAGNISGISSLQYAFIIESQETLMVGAASHANTAVGGYLGAIIVPFDSGSGEQNGRVFGMFTEPDNISGFNQANIGWGGNTNTALSEHAGIFIVSGGNPNGPIGSNGNIDNLIRHISHLNYLGSVNDAGTSGRGDFTTSEETGVVYPYLYVNYTSTNVAIGYGRQYYQFNEYGLGDTLVTQSNGVFGPVGIIVNTSFTGGATDAMLFSNIDI